MDPFLHLYCKSCFNVYMHCDCVESFVDAIEDGEDSHESEGEEEDEDEDDMDEQGDIGDPNLITPSPKKRKDPWGAANPGVLVDKPNNLLNNFDDAVVTPSPSQRPRITADFTNAADVMRNYYGFKGSETVPRPFITTPRNQELIDLGMPINTNPYNPENDDFAKELFDWYTNLSPEDKQLYNGACFVASDPKDSQQTGYVGDIFVTFKDNPPNSPSKYKYGIVMPDGSEYVVLSDIRLPPRAFSGYESIHEYFFKDGEHYRPRYKQGRARSSLRDPFYQGDSMGSRMARNPNQWKDFESPTTIAANPEIAEPDDPKPVLTNNVNNTRALTGLGTKSSPFLASLGTVNSTKWATFTNCSTTGGGGYGTALLKAKDNQGDPLFGVRWYSSNTGNHCAYIQLHEMINRNGTSPTYGVCGFVGISNTTQNIGMNCLTPYINTSATADNTNSVFHEISINDVVIRNIGDTADFIIPVTANVPFVVKAIVRCDPDQVTYDKSKGGYPYVIWWPKTNVFPGVSNVEFSSVYQLVKKNSLVAVGEPDNPPGNPSFVAGENVSWGSECPTSYAARNNGTLPNNQQMVLTDDILSKIIIYSKTPVGLNTGRANYYNSSGAIIKIRLINFLGNGQVIPLVQGTETSNPDAFSLATMGKLIPNLATLKMFKLDNTNQSNDILEREYSYVVYNDEWAI